MIQFLPGQRESRCYVGEHILTQNDLESEGRFEDRVAYGHRPMDDHHLWHTYSLSVLAEHRQLDARRQVRVAGRWREWQGVADNHQRVARVKIAAEVEGVRVILDATWGSGLARLFAFYVE